MSKAVTIGQARSLTASFIVDTPWDEIQGDPQATQNFIELTPAERGRRFADFVANGCRLIIGEPKIIKLDSSEKLDLVKLIGDETTIWKGLPDGDGLEGDEDIDQRSLGLLEVDISKIIMVTCLGNNNSLIVGEEKLKRLKALRQTIRLGGNVFLALLQDYRADKDNSCLEWLRKNRGVTYVDFFGLIIRSPSGYRCVMFFYFRGDEWHWSYCKLSDKWGADRASLGVAS